MKSKTNSSRMCITVLGILKQGDVGGNLGQTWLGVTGGVLLGTFLSKQLFERPLPPIIIAGVLMITWAGILISHLKSLFGRIIFDFSDDCFPIPVALDQEKGQLQLLINEEGTEFPVPLFRKISTCKKENDKYVLIGKASHDVMDFLEEFCNESGVFACKIEGVRFEYAVNADSIPHMKEYLESCCH